MQPAIRRALDNIHSGDKDLQNEAFTFFLQQTGGPVDWAYEVWDELVASLNRKDNRERSIASQVLCNLAKSDPKKRMLKDIDALLAVTKDERFVTARHCLQSLWKVGVAGEEQQKGVVEGLTRRYNECTNEKNCTLIRYDIVESLRKIYDETHNEKIKQQALELIETEEDQKYRRKYLTVWRAA